MPYWYYDKEAFKNTPSIKDGINYATEYKYRKQGARFIVEMGSDLELGYNTSATGAVYFHRFYMFQSFKDFPHYVTACCCLFLAGKVEETPKKCKDIIKAAQKLLGEENFKTFGDDPKEEVMIMEKIVLQTIKFDLKVQHPYSFLTKYAKTLKGEKSKLQKIVQMAWTFVNDSLCTTLSIQWEPEIVAIALMYLAMKLSKFHVTTWKGQLPNQTRWWEIFVQDLEMNVIEDICHQVLDLYSPEKEEMKPREYGPLQLTLKALSRKNLDQEKPAVSSASIALVSPQNAAVSCAQIARIPTVTKEAVNTDPHTMATKTEPIYEESEPPPITIAPVYIKSEPLITNISPANIEIPFYNPLMTKTTFSGTSISTTSSVVYAGNSQPYSPSVLLPNNTMPPSAFNLPTTAILSAKGQTTGNYIHPWKTDVLTYNETTETDKIRQPIVSAEHGFTGNYIYPWKTNEQMNNENIETNKFQGTVAYPAFYSTNCQRNQHQDIEKGHFHVIRFRNPDNDTQRRSNWEQDWVSPSNSFNNESPNFVYDYQHKKFSNYLSNRDNRRNRPYYNKDFNKQRLYKRSSKK